MSDEWIDVTDQYAPQSDESDEWIDVTPIPSGATEEWLDAPPNGIEYMLNQPPPENEPSWGETFGTNIGTGAANFVGGVGTLINAIPGFDLGVGKYIKDFAAPYELGGEQFNQQIPADSWKRTFGNVTRGLSGTLPALPFGGGTAPGMATVLGLNTYGQTSNQVERELQPKVLSGEISPEEAQNTATGTAAINTIFQTPLNMIGMAPVFNKALPIRSRGLYAGATNAPFSVLGAGSDMYARYLGGASNERPTLESIMEVAPEAALEGFLTGFGAGTFQASADSVADYKSAKALKAETQNVRALIDADMATRQAEMPTVPPDVSMTEDGFAFSPTGVADRVFDQKAAQDFATQQALTKMGVTDPVGAELAKAQIAKESSYAGKLEIEAKAISEAIPKIEAEIAGLKKMKEQWEVSDPLNAEAFTVDIKQREENLASSRARLEQVKKELDPAPINSDPVVAKERMLAPVEEAPPLDLNEQLKTEIIESEKILQNENLPIEQKLAISESLTAKKLELQQLEQQGITLDNSSNVFPEVVAEPSPLESYAKNAQKDVKAVSERVAPASTNLDEAIRIRQTAIDDLNKQRESPNTTPEMSQEIASKLEIESAVLKTLQSKKTEASKEQPTIKTLEEGSTKAPVVKASPTKPKDPGLIEDLPNPYTLTGLADIIKSAKGQGFRKLPKYYNFFASKWKNPITSQITKADKYPWFRKSHEASIKHFEEENLLATKHAESTRPYQLLNAKEKLQTDALAYELMRRGTEFDASPANLKRLGFSDRVIRGYKSVRDGLDRAADMLGEEAIIRINDDSSLNAKEKEQKITEINQKIAFMKASNYVPTGRDGKYGLTLWNKDGTISEYIKSDSKVKLLKTLYAKLRTNSELSAEKSFVGKVPKPKGSEYIGAHPDIIDIMGDTDAHIPSSNFLNRLKRKQLIEGFDEDLGKNLASYFSSHARYISTQRLKRVYAQNNKDFNSFYEKLGKRDKELYAGLKGEIENLQKWMLTPSDSFNGLSKFLAEFHLGNSAKTVAVNTLSFLNAVPNMARYMSAFDNATFQPEWAMAKALKDTTAYYSGRAFRKKDGIVGKDLYASIEAARDEGAIGGSRVMKDMLRDSKRPSPTGPLQNLDDRDLLFLTNSASEDFVRTNNYIMAWHSYDKARPYFEKRNIPMPNRHEFAKRMISETQGDYKKTGIPNIARNGLGKMASTFRLFHHAFFTTIKKSVMEGSFGAMSRYAAILGGLGGVYAVPWLSGILKSAKSAGFDPDEGIEDITEKVGKGIEYVESKLPDLFNREFGKYLQTEKGKQAVKYGPATDLLGVNISNSLDTTPFRTENPKGDPLGFIARAVLGVAGDPVDRLDKFWYFLNEKSDFGRAFEQLVPRSMNASDFVQNLRIRKEGLNDPQGVNYFISGRKPTESELRLKSWGFTPSAWAAAYDARSKEKAIEQENSIDGLYNKIAKEMRNGNQEGADKLMAEAVSKGANVKDLMRSVMEWSKKMESPEYAQDARISKKNREKVRELNEKIMPLIDP